MNIVLIGYGRMGQRIHAKAMERNHNISAIIDPKSNMATATEINAESLALCDVCIDFSLPTSALENVKKVAMLGKNLIIGTTGWYEDLDKVKELVTTHETGFLYASNFSLGINLFYKLLNYTSNLFDQFAEYDIAGMESHHRGKVDAPSGTARDLAQIILDNMQRKTKVEFDLGNRKVDKEELHFPSIRCGSVPGKHSILLDSDEDSIELSHTIRNRDGLAIGALRAAEWLHGKKGFYHFRDMLDAVL